VPERFREQIGDAARLTTAWPTGASLPISTIAPALASSSHAAHPGVAYCAKLWYRLGNNRPGLFARTQLTKLPICALALIPVPVLPDPESRKARVPPAGDTHRRAARVTPEPAQP
jgi:hypothetical protein